MAFAPTCGLILLGNSGVGKSFLANRLLNDDQAFESRFSAKSVTRLTEWKELETSDRSRIYAVANIPGLIEADQKLVDSNRHEIMKAFEQYPLSIVIFVFGHKNGRIPDEDLVAFMCINDAYQFSPESLIIIVNGIPNDRPDDYIERTTPLLHQLTHVDMDRIYFIEKTTSEEDKQAIHQLLAEAVTQCVPCRHIKKQDIQLITDELAQLKGLCKQRQDQLLAQAEKQSNGQKTSRTIDQADEHTSTQRQISLMETGEPKEDPIAEQKRKFNEWFKAKEAKFNQSTARIHNQLHNPERDAALKLADDIKKDSERQKEIITHIPAPQHIIFTKERKRDKVVRKLVDGIEMVGDSFHGSEKSDSESVHSPICDDRQRGAAPCTTPSLPPHQYNPRYCKHDAK